MKFAASIIKSFKENMRDWKVLVMVLAFSPFFVLLMKLFYGGEPTIYNLGILNLDAGSASSELIKTLENARGQDSARLFNITKISSQDQINAEVKEKSIDVGIVISQDYSKKLRDIEAGKNNSPAVVNFYGSMGNVRYTVGAILAYDVVFRQGIEVAKITLPSSINETFLEKKQPLNEFEGYVPGLISLAVLMVLFSASASIVKESDKKTLVRLKLSRIGAFNYLAGVSVVQTAIGILAIVLSYWTALGLGYRPTGDFGSVLVIGIFSCISIVAISLIVASFLNTVYDVLTIGCFPFFILMFFSGSMFPLPKMNMISIGGHTLGITDILPLTHTANAFNKILNYDSGITGVAFEIFMIALLSSVYFVLGIIFYQKRKLSKA